MIKIAKFGGSSVASAEQFKKVKAIVEADPDRRFIVSSAAGKRHSTDNKITDLLLLVNAHIEYHVDCASLLADIETRFVEIADELGVAWPVAEEFEKFATNIKSFSPEYVVSRGEWFTCQILAEYLGLPFVDAADVMLFHHDGTIDMERTASRLKEVVARSGSFVLPGFYGATVDGAIKLFQRGGGDITGAIVARCLRTGLTFLASFLRILALFRIHAPLAVLPLTRCASFLTWALPFFRKRQFSLFVRQIFQSRLRTPTVQKMQVPLSERPLMAIQTST